MHNRTGTPYVKLFFRYAVVARGSEIFFIFFSELKLGSILDFYQCMQEIHPAAPPGDCGCSLYPRIQQNRSI